MPDAELLHWASFVSCDQNWNEIGGTGPPLTPTGFSDAFGLTEFRADPPPAKDIRASYITPALGQPRFT